MTEARRRRRPSAAPVVWGSLALFAVLFALLTYQLSGATGATPRPVVHRKVIEQRVVTTVVPGPEGAPEGGAEAAEAGATSEAPPVESAPPVETAPPLTTSAS